MAAGQCCLCCCSGFAGAAGGFLSFPQSSQSCDLLQPVPNWPCSGSFAVFFACLRPFSQGGWDLLRFFFPPSDKSQEEKVVHDQSCPEVMPSPESWSCEFSTGPFRARNSSQESKLSLASVPCPGSSFSPAGLSLPEKQNLEWELCGLSLSCCPLQLDLWALCVCRYL